MLALACLLVDLHLITGVNLGSKDLALVNEPILTVLSDLIRL